MAMFSFHNPTIFVFGVLGNIASFMVFLAPIPTFVRICKKRSVEGFQSVPYVVSLLSAMLWILYASLKSNEALLITVNSVGCIVEIIYIAIYVAFAPKKAKVSAVRFILLLNFGGFCFVLLLSHTLAKGSTRIRVIGWICVVFSVIVFAAPLSIMREVIRTKSVEFMPFSLSFSLTLSAVLWLFYGVLLKDLYVTLPNVGGCALGVAQMILYLKFKNSKNLTGKPKLPEYRADHYQGLNPVIKSEKQEHSQPVGELSGNKQTDEMNGQHDKGEGHRSLEITVQSDESKV